MKKKCFVLFGKKLPIFVLRLLVKRDLNLRAEGKRPDKWYWADEELIKRGLW